MIFFWFLFHRMPVHQKLDFSFWIPIFSCTSYSTLYIHLPFLQSSCAQPPGHCLVLLLNLAFTVHHIDFNSVTVFGIPTSLLLFNLLFILVYSVSSICHLHLINFMISYIFYAEYRIYISFICCEWQIIFSISLWKSWPSSKPSLFSLSHKSQSRTREPPSGLFASSEEYFIPFLSPARSWAGRQIVVH